MGIVSEKGHCERLGLQIRATSWTWALRRISFSVVDMPDSKAAWEKTHWHGLHVHSQA